MQDFNLDYKVLILQSSVVYILSTTKTLQPLIHVTPADFVADKIPAGHKPKLFISPSRAFSVISATDLKTCKVTHNRKSFKHVSPKHAFVESGHSNVAL